MAGTFFKRHIDQLKEIATSIKTIKDAKLIRLDAPITTEFQEIFFKLFDEHRQRNLESNVLEKPRLWEYCKFKTFQREINIQLKHYRGDKIRFLTKRLQKLEEKYDEGYLFHITKEPNDFIKLDFFDEDLLEQIISEESKKIEYIKNLISDTKTLNENIVKKESENLLEFPSDVFQTYYYYRLFMYLNDNFSYHKAKAKYISLYHFFEKEVHGFRCTQSMYIDFIFKTFNEKISKITTPTYRYKTKSLPQLKEFYKIFKEEYN